MTSTKRSIKIGIGTVQWGMAYGISNSTGKTSEKEVENILSLAHNAGIKLIDTAALYGEAEKVLGYHSLDEFLVVTKTIKLAKSEIDSEDAKLLIKSFEKSLRDLRVGRVYGLLIHHPDDLLVKGGQYLVEALWLLKNRGLVEKIGVSIYDSRQLKLLCNLLKPDIIQLPLNALDQRLIKDGSLNYLNENGIEIHSRSVFLQGLLLMPLDDLPSYFTPWRRNLELWHRACQQQGFTPLEAALNFVMGIEAVNHCVIGLENVRQLQDCIRASQKAERFDACCLFSSDINLINPANWRHS